VTKWFTVRGTAFQYDLASVWILHSSALVHTALPDHQRSHLPNILIQQ